MQHDMMMKLARFKFCSKFKYKLSTTQAQAERY